MRRALGMVAGLIVLAGCGEDPPLREATSDERQEIDTAVRGWLAGIADGDAEAACRHLTDEVLKRSEEEGQSCEQVVRAVDGQLVEESRRELLDARVERAFVRGDEATAELDARTRYTGQMLTRSFKLERSENGWRLAGVGLEPGNVGEIATCNVSGMHAWDSGEVDPFWKREGRADWRAFIAEACRRTAEQGDLDAEGAEVMIPDRIAVQVIRKMIRDGRIRVPR